MWLCDPFRTMTEALLLLEMLAKSRLQGGSPFV